MELTGKHVQVFKLLAKESDSMLEMPLLPVEHQVAQAMSAGDRLLSGV